MFILEKQTSRIQGEAAGKINETKFNFLQATHWIFMQRYEFIRASLSCPDKR